MLLLLSNFVNMEVFCLYFQDHMISMLLKSGKKEPAGLARCIAISSLGIFLYEELSHNTMHPKLKEAIHVLLLTLKVGIYFYKIKYFKKQNICLNFLLEFGMYVN